MILNYLTKEQDIIKQEFELKAKILKALTIQISCFYNFYYQQKMTLSILILPSYVLWRFFKGFFQYESLFSLTF